MNVGVICYLKQVTLPAYLLHIIINFSLGYTLIILRMINVLHLYSSSKPSYCFVLQLLDTGFFHADPHPGNMIRTPDGKLAILDFGNGSSSN